jgi:hypothetical protein
MAGIFSDYTTGQPSNQQILEKINKQLKRQLLCVASSRAIISAKRKNTASRDPHDIVLTCHQKDQIMIQP